MRKRFDAQYQIGATPIHDIRFNPKSRDDIPQVLRGLQTIFTTPDLHEAVFGVMEKYIDTSSRQGRPGMDLWQILVMGCLRLNLNWDYDRLHEMVNEHQTIRVMLTLNTDQDFGDPSQFQLQTLKDNVRLLSPEMLDEINHLVVQAGHKLVKKKDEPLAARCDSYVVETHAEYPTDIRLLNNAMSDMIRKISHLFKKYKVSGWRQSDYNIEKVGRFYQRAQRSKKKPEAIKQLAYAKYLKVCQVYLNKAIENIETLYINHQKNLSPEDYVLFSDKVAEIRDLQAHAVRQIDQIRSRAIDGKNIPAPAKIYSIHQPHTEWVVKGKAGVPMELGVKVCIVEDQYQFILTHHVMYKEQDVDIAVLITQKAKQLFPELDSCSYDKGFHSPDNQKKLAEILRQVILPKKGNRNKEERERETSEEFTAKRKQHSAVESCINALEQHGLDCCPDQGQAAFDRYISLGVLARNVQQLGRIVANKENKKRKKTKSPPFKKAA